MESSDRKEFPCGECLHDVGSSSGMAGASQCLLRFDMIRRLAAVEACDGELVCSAFEPAFAPADAGCLH